MAFLLVACLGAGVGAQPVTAHLLDGSRVNGSFGGFGADGSLTLLGSDGGAIPSRELLSLTFSDRSRPPQRGSAQFRFVSGDVLFAVVEEGDFDQVRLTSQAAGQVSVFLEKLAMIRWDTDPAGGPATELPATDDQDADELFLQRGSVLDRLPGELQRLERSGVVFDSEAAGKDRPFSLLKDQLVAVRLHQEEVYAEPPGRLCTARFEDGSRLTGWLESGGDGLRLKLTVGPAVTLDPGLLTGLAFRNDGFRYVSDLEPADVTVCPYLPGGFVPPPIANPAGGVTIAEEQFQKGLLVRARTELSFALPEGARLFRARVGVDPRTRWHPVPGSAKLRVLVDGREVHATGLLTAGESPQKIEVSVADGRRLTLVVEFGESRAAGALLAIGDPMLMND